MRSLRQFWLAGVIASLLAVPVAATPITGVLNVSGAVQISGSTFDFLPLGGDEGIILLDLFTQSGFYVALAGTTGDVGDIDTTTQPVGVPFTTPLWLTFAAAPGASFELQFINPGVFGMADCFAAPAAGQTCTPPGSALNLTNTSGSDSVAFFTVSGIAHGTAGETTPFNGTFTIPSTGQNLQSIVGGTPIEASFAANFIVTEIPEPGSVALIVGGLLIGIARIRSRRSR
jgi:hypothetical protein